MSSLQDTILVDVKKLGVLEGMVHFKSTAYVEKQPLLAESLGKIAACLKQAHNHILKDIYFSVFNSDRSFTKAVKSSSLPASLYLEPMEMAESLSAAQVYPIIDLQLQKIPNEIALLHQRLRTYNKLKLVEIEKLSSVRTAATAFLLGHLEGK